MTNVNDRVELQIRDRVFNRRIHTFAIVNKDHIDIESFLNDAFHIYESEVTRILEEFNIVKSLTIFAAEFEKKITNVNDQVNRDGQSAHVNLDSDIGDGDASDSDSEAMTGGSVNRDFDIDDGDASGSDSEAMTSGSGNRDSDIGDGDGDGDEDSGSSEQTVKERVYFRTSNNVIGLETNLNEHFRKKIVGEIVKSVDDCALRGSGFTLARIIELGVQICSYEPLVGHHTLKHLKKYNRKKQS